MQRAVLMVAVAGCAAKQAEPFVPPAQPAHDDPPVGALRRTAPVAAERPAISLSVAAPDPEHDLRWPLSVAAHPTLEPSFAIAQELAEPGLGWVDLCRMGGTNRFGGAKVRDLMTYLRAWCAVSRGDLDGGLGMLVSLQTSVTRGLGPAVRTDIISVLAAGDAERAQRLMNKHRLLDLERLDLLAGTYVELGKPDDAHEINVRALASDRVANREHSCRRLARSIVLGPEDLRDAPLEALRAHAHQEKADPVCVELHAELSCWVFITRDEVHSLTAPLAHCGPYWVRGNVPVDQRRLLDAYFSWPRTPAPAVTWLNVGTKAAGALGVEGADQLAVRALEATVEAAACTGDHSDEARRLANRIMREPTRVKTVEEARLIRLVFRWRDLCPGRRD